VRKQLYFLIGIICLFTLSGCYTNPNTPEGHEGYVWENPRLFGEGGFQGIVKGPGNYGFSFLKNEVINVDFRPTTHKEDFKILAKDELNVEFSFQFVMKPTEGKIKEIVEKYDGKYYYPRYIVEPLRSYVRNAVRQLESMQIKTKRKEISNDVCSEIKSFLKDAPFDVLACVVGNIEYPEVVTKAVEQKMAARQELEKKTTELEMAKKDAEIRIADAHGLSEAQKIINSTLTDRYLQHEAIQAQLKMANSPNHTTVYIPSGLNGIPLIKNIK
jgi:regulator of protease activity HflC (stomatin/prohibitin superfamily)